VGQELLAVAAVVAMVLVVIPVLFFGLELILVGVLLAAGVVGADGAWSTMGGPGHIARSDGSRPTVGVACAGLAQIPALDREVTAELEPGREPSTGVVSRTGPQRRHWPRFSQPRSARPLDGPSEIGVRPMSGTHDRSWFAATDDLPRVGPVLRPGSACSRRCRLRCATGRQRRRLKRRGPRSTAMTGWFCERESDERDRERLDEESGGS
jgi:hypothetical protein